MNYAERQLNGKVLIPDLTEGVYVVGEISAPDGYQLDQSPKNVTVTSGKLATVEFTNKPYSGIQIIKTDAVDGGVFMADIAAFITAIVRDNNAPKPEFIALFPATKKPATESLGSCPRCGSPVREGTKGFFCDKRDCGFKLWRESKFWTAKKKPLTAAIVKALLKDGRVALKGLFSEKTGKKYDAIVVLDDSGDGFVNFKMEFKK